MEGAGGSRRSAFRPVWVLLLCLILTITVIVGLFASRELADRVGFGVADSGVQNAQQVCDRLTPARLEEITGVAWSQGEANPRPGTLSDLASIDKACTVRGKPPPGTDRNASGLLVVTVIIAHSRAEASQHVDRVITGLRGRHTWRLEDVPGVGDKATWSPEKWDLGVIKGNRGYLVSLCCTLSHDSPRGASLKIVELVMS